MFSTAIALILTSLVLPCLCIICGVAWTVEDRSEQKKRMQAEAVDAAVGSTASRMRRRLQRNNHRSYSWLSPRVIVEYIARIGISIVFVVCTLVIGTSPLVIEYEDSGFIVANQIKGGMAAYALGLNCGLFVLVLLRFGKTNVHGICEPAHEACYEGNLHRSRNFECSWEVHSNELFTGLGPRARNTQQHNTSHNELAEMEAPLLQNEWWNNSPTSTGSPAEKMSVQTKRTGIPLWKRVVLYELASFSTLLWLPALFLPLFRLEYGGIVSDFMPEVSLSFRLKDIPAEIWERGTSTGTSRLMLWMIENNFVLLVLVCPVLANMAAIGSWVCDAPFRTCCKNILWMMQPCLGTIVFGVAVLVSVPAFETIPEVVIRKFAADICDKFELVTSDTCFSINAEPSLGLWFLLGQALALELFVLATLSWDTVSTQS